MSIVLLGGSPAAVSGSGRLLQHIGDLLAQRGHRVGAIAVRDLPPRALLHADLSDRAIADACNLVAEAEAIVVATPVYKASYSGILKTFLDLLPQHGLEGKLLLPVATGGSQSHMLALDYALRPVLAALSAKHVLTSIYATPEQMAWSDEHGLSLAPTIATRVNYGVCEMSAALTAQHRRSAQTERRRPAIASRQMAQQQSA